MARSVQPSFFRLAVGLSAALLSCAWWSACAPGDAVPELNRNASSPPGADPASQTAPQSETALAVVYPVPGGQSRLILAYNDNTNTFSNAANGTYNLGASVMGWSASDDEGGTWTRHGQIPVAQGASYQTLISDPWLAARGSTVVYTFDASPNQTADQYHGIAVASFSWDGGTSFSPPVALSGDPHYIDGPKVAITRDGSYAVVVWQTSTNLPNGQQVLPAEFTILDLHQNGAPVRAPQILDPVANQALWPQFVGQNGCIVAPSGVQPTIYDHPMVAAGNQLTFYLAFSIRWDALQLVDGQGNPCTPPVQSQTRHEVWRTTDGISWERILSVVGKRQEILMWAQGPDPANSYARRGTLPAMVVSRWNGGDVIVLAAAEERDPNPNLPEAQRQKVIVYRLPGADTCVIAVGQNDGDLCGCGNCPAQGVSTFEADQNFVVKGKPLLADRAGVQQYQPALFVGRDTEDSRVGLIWYTQPYAGLKPAAPLAQEEQTIVEGTLSQDAGASFGVVATITQQNGEADQLWDNPTGQYFIPCPLAPNPGGGYFGDYIAGAFLDPEDKSSLRAIASWTDSRLGCISQTNLGTTYHQHAYFGGVWWSRNQ